MPPKTDESIGDCFFITPIGDEGSPERQRADWVYHQVVKPSALALRLRPQRADLMNGSSMIGTNIFRALAEAPVCVADLTGLNPNVLYEIGVRHCLRKPIVHIAQRGTRLPFDNAPHLTHFYDLAEYQSMSDLRGLMQSEFGHLLETGYEVSNPFTQALGAIEIARSGDPLESLVTQLSERLRTVEVQLAGGDRPIRLDFNTEEDAKHLLKVFCATKDLSEPYSPETLRRALDLATSDFNLYVEVGKAIEACRRSNRAELKAVYNDHIPF